MLKSYNMEFTWIPFYKEFASKLLQQFRNDRKSLLGIIYNNVSVLKIDYLHDMDNEPCTDIDPFTVFGIFNRGITKDSRIKAAEKFKEIFSIEADVPTDFLGVPTLNNLKSLFFGFKDKRDENDVENLWRLFEAVVNGSDYEKEYKTVIKQFLININLTMGLFWIRPEQFLSFDKTNKIYLERKYGINLPDRVPDYKQYIELLNKIKEYMASNKIKEKSYYEISANVFNSTGDKSFENNWCTNTVKTWKKRKNIVLYGAPGTGKTYHIAELAVYLCCPEFDFTNKSRKEIMDKYQSLKDDRRIAFTTFHQSMDYEDWIEGLRPVVNDNNQVNYEIETGIFKRLCEDAERQNTSESNIGIADNAAVWKVSLMGTGDNPIRQNCMQNGIIRIGWDDYGPEISDKTDWSIYDGSGKQCLDAYINKMKIGDIVLSCFSERTIDAIGVVTGEYEFDNKFDNYKRVRKVNWLLKGIDEDIVDLNVGKKLTLSTVYRLNNISIEKVKSLLTKYNKNICPDSDIQPIVSNEQPYIMVIDELNRGNVSKIFGELITLLEPDKRNGNENKESVILPYSKQTFSVPKNVYIIATMNTADRSLGTLDYAIRRRFAFIPCKPHAINDKSFDFELFKEVSSLFISNFDEYQDSGCNQSLKLIPADTLSEEYKPEDVWIGHSYFLMTDEKGENHKISRLLYEIIPLLEEYVKDGVLSSEAQETIDHLYDLATES